jgi:hypothetical protein
MKTLHAIGLVAVLGLTLAPEAASAQFTCAAAASNGDLDPDGVPLSGSFGLEVGVNAAGDVLFVGRQSAAGARDRLYLFSGAGNETIAVANTVAPNGKTFKVARPFSRPSINDAGDLAFHSRLATASDGSGLFVREAGGALETAAARNVAAPAPLAGSFQAFPALSAINAGARLAFVATVTDPATPSGIFVYDAPSDSTSLLVGQNAAVPDQPGSVFCSFESVALGDSGEVAFVAAIGPDCIGSVQKGVFHTVGGIAATAVLAGDPTPLGITTTYAKFLSRPQLNAAGKVGFGASVGGTAATSAIFLFDPAGPSVIALAARGDGTPASLGYGFLGQVKAFRLDDADRAHFLTPLVANPARSGVLRYDGTIAGRTVVQTRSDAPPMPPFAAGAKYAKLYDPSIASDGSVVAMLAKVRDNAVPRGRRSVLTCTP